MKTAISLPDILFSHLQAYSKKTGMARSTIIAEALKKYLDEIESSRITEKLNKVYEKKKSTLPPDVAISQVNLLVSEGKREDW